METETIGKYEFSPDEEMLLEETMIALDHLEFQDKELLKQIVTALHVGAYLVKGETPPPSISPKTFNATWGMITNLVSEKGSVSLTDII